MVGLCLRVILLQEVQERIGAANLSRCRGSGSWCCRRISERGLSSIVCSELGSEVRGGSRRLGSSGLLERLDGSNVGVLGLDTENDVS